MVVYLPIRIALIVFLLLGRSAVQLGFLDFGRGRGVWVCAAGAFAFAAGWWHCVVRGRDAQMLWFEVGGIVGNSVEEDDVGRDRAEGNASHATSR
jgi:hypothetical protein